MTDLPAQIINFISKDPFYGVLNFEWGLSLFEKLVKEKTKINLFIIADTDYQKHNRNGVLFAKLHKRSFINKVKTLIKDKENSFIIDYDTNRFLVISPYDLTEDFDDIFDKDVISIGATALIDKPEENIATILTRAEMALKETYTASELITTL